MSYWLQIVALSVHCLSLMIYSGSSLYILSKLRRSYSYRSSDPIMRKKYVALVEAVQQKGAEVVIFSSMHESGQRTAKNIIAIPCR